MLTLQENEFVSIENRAERAYIDKVWALYENRTRGCSDCEDRSIDMSLHNIVSLTQWQQDVWTGDDMFNVLTSADVFSIFSNTNNI